VCPKMRRSLRNKIGLSADEESVEARSLPRALELFDKKRSHIFRSDFDIAHVAGRDLIGIVLFRCR
jgi:hypothetical protein